MKTCVCQFSSVTFVKIINQLIAAKDVPSYAKFANESSAKKLARKRRGNREAKLKSYWLDSVLRKISQI